MTRTNKILLAAVAVCAATCAFYFLVLAPKREEVARLDGEIAAKTAEMDAARQQLASYERAKANYRRNYATLARLGKAVPTDDDVRSLLVQLESTADRSGVDFEKIELGTGLGSASTQPDAAAAKGGPAPAPGAVPVAGGALSAMPFSLTFTGGFFDLSAFLARVEDFVTVNNRRLDATGRLLRLESISIAPAPAGFPQMQAQINAATYLVPPVEGVAGAEPAAPAAGGTAPATPGTTPPTTTAAATTGATQ